jgi:capsular polysaccharide biosynthesis protein
MNQLERYEEINLMECLEVLWKRKWLIIVPTIAVAILAGIISFLMKPVWQVDAIIQPSKFLIQTEQGQFQEVYVVDPKQVSGQINQASYNNLLASELNIDFNKFPDIKAENLRDTKLVRIWVRESDIEKGKKILNSLFLHLKADFDKKIDVEIKGMDTEIAKNENAIKKNELDIKDKWNEIKLLNIQKTKTKEGIATDTNKLKISEDRFQNITEEMKSVKKRIDEIEEQLKKALEEKRQGSDAVGLLLYSNEVQNNFRYYNTLEEKMSVEKITQESLRLSVKEKSEDIKQLDTQIDKLKNEVDKIKNTSENFKNQISLLTERKLRIDYAQLIKEPTPSKYPVAPRKKTYVFVAGFFGLIFFGLLAFLLEYIESHKKKKITA